MLSPYLQSQNLTLYHGHTLDVLQQLQPTGKTAIVSDIPYFGQVDYETDDQIGVERQLTDYLDALHPIARECLRLVGEGDVAYIIVGDTSNNYSPVRAQHQRRQPQRGQNKPWRYRRPIQQGYLEKESLDVPARVLELFTSVGWRHRRTLIWDKGQTSAVPNSDTAPLTYVEILHLFRWSGRDRPYLHSRPLKSAVLRHLPVATTNHPNITPPSLLAELLDSLVDCRTVVDPFCGLATIPQMAALRGMHGIGIDCNASYLDTNANLCNYA